MYGVSEVAIHFSCCELYYVFCVKWIWMYIVMLRFNFIVLYKWCNIIINRQSSCITHNLLHLRLHETSQQLQDILAAVQFQRRLEYIK